MYFDIAIIIVIISLGAIVGEFQRILPNEVFVALTVEIMTGGAFEAKVFLLQLEVAPVMWMKEMSCNPI